MKNGSGVVYLVGAGPGDPDLLTVKGLRLLRDAEVVVYDRLASPGLIAEAPHDAEMVYVGKGPQGHVMEQEAINALLVACARRGRNVVRLKGGDPFLFGRGGEEADALVAAGIRFEVVPGVTAAIAVPAYAGIPVTDRRAASSVRIITGHAGEDAANDGSQHRGTIIALMGVGGLPDIVGRLLKQGWSSTTPAALIERGTTPRQRTVETTLEEAVRAAKEAQIQPPATIVIGEVVRFRRRLAWFGADRP